MTSRARTTIAVLGVALVVAALVWLGRAGLIGLGSGSLDLLGVGELGAAEERAEQPGAASEPVAGSQVPDDARTTMTLVGGDISLSYPAGFGLAVNQDQLLVSSYIPTCDQGFDYCLYLASGEFDGTNFDAAGLSVTVREDLDHEAACMLEPPAGYSGQAPVLEGAADHATALFGGIGQGAAGHFTNGALYRLHFGGTCYEFESRVGQTQYANYEPGAVERFEEADQAELEERLAGIMASVSLPDGRDELWSRSVDAPTRTDAGAVRGLEPAAGAAVTSPFELSGEATGSWFFEATFPYRLETTDGTVLASGAVEALADWMTADFVPFVARVEFDVAAATEATLVLMNDNPSGLAENDASVEVRLRLMP